MGQIELGCFPRFNGHMTAGNVCLQKSLSLWKDTHNTNRKAVSMVQMLQRSFMKISVQQTEQTLIGNLQWLLLSCGSPTLHTS